VIDVAGAGCDSEYVVTDNGLKVLAVVPETDEVSRVDAAGWRLSVDVEDAAVAVVSLDVLNWDDAGRENQLRSTKMND
jgi:hypothetical protein